MAIRSHQAVGKRDHFAITLHGKDTPGEVLEIDLVNDSGARRNYAKVVERPLGPFEQFIPLAIAPVLFLDIRPIRVF